MPKVTIWIRVADEAKWKAIEKKPEWLHAVLNDDWIMEAIKYIDKGEDGKPVFVMQQDKFMKFGKNPIPISNNPFMENIRDNINNKQIDNASKAVMTDHEHKWHYVHGKSFCLCGAEQL